MRSSSPAAARFGSLQVLRHRDYAVFVGGGLIALTGQWMQRVALAWLVWELTRSTLWLGFLSAADLLPATLIGLVGGAIADRVNRYRLVRGCYGATTVAALVFGGLELAGMLGPRAILVLVLLQGISIALSHPARLALLQSLVPREDSGRAVAVGAVTVNMARLIGPATGGWLIYYFGISAVFFLCAAMQLVFLACFLIVPDPQERRVPRPSGSILSEIRDGVVYLWRIPVMPEVLVFLLMSGIFLRSMVELVPAFAARGFDVSSIGVAVMSSTMAAGAVLSGLTVNPGADPSWLVPKIKLCWVIASLAVCVLAFSTAAVPAVCAMAVLGCFMTRGMIMTQTYIQMTVSDRMRGRAVSIFALLSRGSPLFGALAVGAAADRLGLTLPVMTSGAVMLVFSGLALLRQGH